jgi:hypothetical protein
MMRRLLTTLRKTALALTYSEAAQSVKVFGCVIAPPGRRATGQGNCSEPLTESEPVTTYSERISGLTDCEGMLLLKHAPTLKFADKFR